MFFHLAVPVATAAAAAVDACMLPEGRSPHRGQMYSRPRSISVGLKGARTRMYRLGWLKGYGIKGCLTVAAEWTKIMGSAIG